MAYRGEFQVHGAATPMASPSLQDRMTSHLNAISISDDALPTDPHANSSRQSSGYNRPPAQTQRAEPVYPLGTREEVQAEDYQSPIAGMFGRAWSRFRIAEEVRQAERAMNPEAPVFAYNPAQSRPSLSSHPAIPSVVMPQSNQMGFQAQYAGNGMPVVIMNGMSHMAQQYPTAFFQGHPASGDHLIQASSHQHLAPHGMPPVMYANPFVRPPDEEPEQYDEEHEHGDEYDDLQPSAIDRQTQRPEPLTEEQKIANIACKVCGEQKIDTLTEPCMHIATCHWCAQIWEEEYRRRRMHDPHAKHRCVVCRRTVKNTRRVYLP